MCLIMIMAFISTWVQPIHLFSSSPSWHRSHGMSCALYLLGIIVIVVIIIMASAIIANYFSQCMLDIIICSRIYYVNNY